MDTLLFKLILTPLLIGLVSLAGRRWGPGVSGWLVALPLSSGPIVLFLALDQGINFAAASAQAIMLGIVSAAIFCLVYSWLARRWSWLPTLLVGWAGVFLSVTLLNQFSLPLVPTYLGVLVALGIVIRLLPSTDGAYQAPAAPRWELPIRMLVAGAFVLAITGAAQLLGPHLSGLLAPFPIFASILGGFTHNFQGATAAGKLLRGVATGSFSFATFFLVVALLLQPLGILPTFLCASAVTLAMHGAILWLSLRRPTLATY